MVKTDWFDMVRDFHEAAAPDLLRETPGVPEGGPEAFYGLGFIREELKELEAAAGAGDLVGVADGLGDLVVVVCRMALIWGVPLPEVVSEIMRSNFTKIEGGVTRRADGKVMKGPNYSPPNLAKIIEQTNE